MKTQQECWEALIAGETLEAVGNTSNCWHLVGGKLRAAVPSSYAQPKFCKPENWRIKPKKLPFVEALRALVNGECRVIGKECGTQIAGHSCFDELLPSDFDAEWELVK